MPHVCGQDDNQWKDTSLEIVEVAVSFKSKLSNYVLNELIINYNNNIHSNTPTPTFKLNASPLNICLLAKLQLMQCHELSNSCIGLFLFKSKLSN